MTLDEITGGSPYGATTIAGRRWLAPADGERAPGGPLSGPQDCGDRKQIAWLTVTREETSHVLQHIDFADPAIFTTSS